MCGMAGTKPKFNWYEAQFFFILSSFVGQEFVSYMDQDLSNFTSFNPHKPVRNDSSSIRWKNKVTYLRMNTLPPHSWDRNPQRGLEHTVTDRIYLKDLLGLLLRKYTAEKQLWTQESQTRREGSVGRDGCRRCLKPWPKTGAKPVKFTDKLHSGPREKLSLTMRFQPQVHRRTETAKWHPLGYLNF